ncbi:cobyrinate a,c-diamide synthase [Tepidanaerobacter sp. GT38]|uniref:cobyrinate a,c-diamide synthase n=1 Tax=Tepidanaerobacter sp. GT38 TaxID=2722793 RepID=UPI00351CE0F4
MINNVKSEAHFRLLKNAIETYLDIAVVGYLKNMPEIKLESRHLGLIPQGEIKDLRQKLTMLSEELKETVDLVLLRKIADENVNYDKNLPDIPKQDIRFSIKPLSPGARIAVAKDQAFNFYYQDNLDLLEMLGAELVYFSPLNDNCLPEGINGLYLGGGYPEIFAAQLEKNKGMMECIKTHITRGLPTYAECGGLMYLSEGIVTDDGEKYDMVGIVPGICRMTKSLQRFGYIEIEVVEDNILAERGEKIRGHEFHYSTIEVNKDVTTSYCISKSRRSSNSVSWKCGFKIHNLLAGYPHIHFWSNPSFAKRFVENCLLFGKERNCL